MAMPTMNGYPVCSGTALSKKYFYDLISCPGFDPGVANSDGSTLLHLAVEYGLDNIVTELVSRGANINQTDFRQVSPLIVAVKHNFKKIAKFLISKGANVNHATSTGETALYIASEKVNLVLTKLLLQNGSDVNAKTNDFHPRPGNTSFLASIPSPYEVEINKKRKSTMLTIMKLLMEYGCDVNVRNFSGNTALHLASDFGDVHTVCVLADSGADMQVRNNLGLTAFEDAVLPDKQRYGIALCFMMYGYQTEVTSFANCPSPIVSVIKGAVNSKEFPGKCHQRYLLLNFILKEMRLDVNTMKEIRGLFDSVPEIKESTLTLCKQYLSLSPPESVQRQCRRVIRKTIGTRLPNTLDLLPVATSIKRFIALDFDFKERNPLTMCELLLAITEGNIVSVKHILGSSLDINLNFTIQNHTPLTLAANLGLADIVKILLQNGASAEALDNRGSALMHEAAWSGHNDILQMAVESGIDINIKNKDGENPLIKAAENGQFNAMTYLLENGCDCDIPSINGFHAIHFTTGSGSVAATRALLQRNVSSTERDPHQNTPLHVASSRGLLYTTQNIDIPALFPSSAAMHLDGIRNAMGLTPSTTYFDDSKNGRSVDHVGVIALLVQSGADTSALNTDNKTPVDVAYQFGLDDVFEYLRQ